jgi:RimJ/RimL family protein N-acetyltransferase
MSNSLKRFSLQILETSRLRLKPYEDEPEQRDKFIELVTDRQVMRKIDEGVYSREAAMSLWRRIFEITYAQNQFGLWAVWTKDEPRFVGSAVIKPRPEKSTEWEIGYILRRDEWGRGFATELARKLIEYGFEELNLSQIFGTVDDDNAASIRVLEKAGMTFARYEYDDKGKFPVYRVKNLSYQS